MKKRYPRPRWHRVHCTMLSGTSECWLGPQRHQHNVACPPAAFTIICWIFNDSQITWYHLSSVNGSYSETSIDQQKVVLIHKWSLYAGSMAWSVYPWGLYNVIFILKAGGLDIQLVFRAYLAVFQNNTPVPYILSSVEYVHVGSLSTSVIVIHCACCAACENTL